MKKEGIKSHVRGVKDYPKPGVNFLDITTVLKNKKYYKAAINKMAALVKKEKIDKIVGLDARGFIFASALAYKLDAGLVIARKKGKLPCETVSRDYGLEYGKSTLEIHTDAISKGEKILIVDDILATGGTARATEEMVAELGGVLVGFLFFAEIAELNGREKLDNKNVKSLLTYDEDIILTTDIVITLKGESIVLIRRVHEPFLDKDVLPGGHVEDTDKSVAHACAREAEEEIGFKVKPNELKLLTVLDAPGRDPRPGRRISIVYHIDLPDESRLAGCKAASDAKSLRLKHIDFIKESEIGFDHFEAIKLIKKMTP